MTATVAEAEAAPRAADDREARLARDLALLQARFGPPQPRAPLRGQLALPGLRAARRRPGRPAGGPNA